MCLSFTFAEPGEHRDLDMSWVTSSIHHGTLLLVCDGSYLPNLTTSRGAAAWILECQSTKHRVTCMHGSPTTTANAYRSELTGVYSALLFISIICDHYKITNGTIPFYCDCKAAIFKSLTSIIRVIQSVKHSDLLP